MSLFISPILQDASSTVDGLMLFDLAVMSISRVSIVGVVMVLNSWIRFWSCVMLCTSESIGRQRCAT